MMQAALCSQLLRELSGPSFHFSRPLNKRKEYIHLLRGVKESSNCVDKNGSSVVVFRNVQ